MTIRKTGFVLCLVLLGSSGRGTAQTRPAWQLVWSDEFNTKQLDASKWDILLREQSKHNELQYYVPDEVYTENGMLRIRSRIRDYGSMHYTSGRLSTDGRFAPVYGRFEIRARMPYGKGLWPAHWLYPQNRDWAMEQLMEKAVAEGRERGIPERRPWYSEIDIMEYLGHEPNVQYGTLHYKTFSGESKTSSGKWQGDVDYSKDFHSYALEWEPDSIRWYIDGTLIHATTLGIPHTPHYLILNTAVGGAWPGNPDSTTTFPQYHDIDYVRVYQRAPAATSSSDALVGTWRVVAYQVWDSAGKVLAPFGEASGYAVFDATRHAHIQLFGNNQFGAYSGTYTVDQATSRLIIKVEGASIPQYIGTDQVRPFRISVDTLTLGIPGEYRADLVRVR